MKIRNKKGFTLIEIIICIALIAVIAVSSIVGFNLVSKNIKINKLNDIQDEILTAAKIYLETNEEASANLYQKKNGVILPLTVLVNEGLLDLTTTDLDLNDVSDEYVVTALSSSSSTDNECIDLRMVTSWDEESDAPLYICSRADGTISLQGSGGQADNVSMVKREIEYIDTEYNYIQYKDVVYRLYYIDKDDSLVLINKGGFNGAFDGRYLSITKRGRSTSITCQKVSGQTCNGNSISYSKSYSTNVNNDDIVNGESNIDIVDLYRFVSCPCGSNSIKIDSHNMLCDSCSKPGILSNHSDYKKIRLKPCMKITGGSGDASNPYILEDKCS